MWQNDSDVGKMIPTCLQGAPTSDVGRSSQERGVLLWQADRLDVVLVVSVAIQDQDSDVKAICLRSKAKVGMETHFSDREHLVRQ